MKKTFNKIKAALSAFWISLISFSSKVMGHDGGYDEYFDSNRIVAMYGVEHIDYYPDIHEPEPSKISTIISTIIKIAPRLLIALTFIIGIVSFIKIKKIDDKILRKRKIKKTTIIIAILIVLIVCLLLLPQVLNKSVSNALF